MSLGFYPTFDPPLKNAQFNALGEALLRHFAELDHIARTRGLASLAEFADGRPVPDDFAGDPDELAEVMGEWTDWFDPAAGRSAAEVLAHHIRSNPKSARLGPVDVLLAELDELARVLRAAEAEGVAFRLEMS